MSNPSQLRTITCLTPLSWNSLDKDIEAGSHYLLQGIFLTQGSTPGLLHCRQICYCLEPSREAPKWVCSFTYSCLTLWPCGLQHTRPPYPYLLLLGFAQIHVHLITDAKVSIAPRKDEMQHTIFSLDLCLICEGPFRKLWKARISM